MISGDGGGAGQTRSGTNCRSILRCSPGHHGAASNPLRGSILTTIRSSVGTSNRPSGRSFTASVMKERHIEAGMLPPQTRVPSTVIGIRPFGWPTQTAATRFGV